MLRSLSWSAVCNLTPCSSRRARRLLSRRDGTRARPQLNTTLDRHPHRASRAGDYGAMVGLGRTEWTVYYRVLLLQLRLLLSRCAGSVRQIREPGIENRLPEVEAPKHAAALVAAFAERRDRSCRATRPRHELGRDRVPLAGGDTLPLAVRSRTVGVALAVRRTIAPLARRLESTACGGGRPGIRGVRAPLRFWKRSVGDQLRTP